MIGLRISITGEIASKTCITPQRWYNHRRANMIILRFILLEVFFLNLLEIPKIFKKKHSHS